MPNNNFIFQNEDNDNINDFEEIEIIPLICETNTSNMKINSRYIEIKDILKEKIEYNSKQSEEKDISKNNTTITKGILRIDHDETTEGFITTSNNEGILANININDINMNNYLIDSEPDILNKININGINNIQNLPRYLHNIKDINIIQISPTSSKNEVTNIISILTYFNENIPKGLNLTFPFDFKKEITQFAPHKIIKRIINYEDFWNISSLTLNIIDFIMLILTSQEDKLVKFISNIEYLTLIDEMLDITTLKQIQNHFKTDFDVDVISFILSKIKIRNLTYIPTNINDDYNCNTLSSVILEYIITNNFTTTNNYLNSSTCENKEEIFISPKKTQGNTILNLGNISHIISKEGKIKYYMQYNKDNNLPNPIEVLFDYNVKKKDNIITVEENVQNSILLTNKHYNIYIINNIYDFTVIKQILNNRNLIDTIPDIEEIKNNYNLEDLI